MIASEPDFFVVGAARDGAEALEKIATLNPDVVTLDVEMPGLGGLETLRCIMMRSPRPVIMVSAVTEKDTEITFNALGAGAFDYVPKQLSAASLDILHIRKDLIAKIKAAGQSRREHAEPGLHRRPPESMPMPALETVIPVPLIVAIGISTGGPKALQDILPLLPQDLSVPIVIVQHMPPGFTAPFAQRLDGLCAISVREASHFEPIRPGVVYIAPAGIHITIERSPESRGIISLSPEPSKSLHIPSVDILMTSVASAFRSLAMGIIMTGMGSDGAEGMKAIHRHGGFTVGQDEATSAVYGMPRACAELGILQRTVPLSEIPQQILRATRYHKHA
jgi:two-component system chemotaxis response regulator CheB